MPLLLEQKEVIVELSFLCEGVFFNSSQSWYSTSPTFTQCFTQTLRLIPALFLLTFAPFYILYTLFTFSKAEFRWTTLNQIKMIGGIILIFMPFMDLLRTAADESAGQTPNLIYYLQPGIITTAMILSVCIHTIEQTRAFTSSVLLFFFYFLSLVMLILTFVNQIMVANQQSTIPLLTEIAGADEYRFITMIIYFIFILVQFVLTCIYDKGIDPHYSYHLLNNVCPEYRSSLLSRMTFSWLDRTVVEGYKKELTEMDVFNLDPVNRVSTIYKKFMSILSPSPSITISTRRPSLNLQAENPQYSSIVETDTTLLVDASSSSVLHVPPKIKKKTNLFISLVRCFGGELFVSWIVMLGHGMILFVQPFLLNRMILFTSDVEPKEPTWHGIFYSFCFFFIGILSSISFHTSLQTSLQVGMRIRSALISCVYRKSVSLSQESRARSTVGEIVNLMTVDANKIADAILYLWVVFVCPIQIAVALYMLWQQLGYGILAGLGVFLVLLPVNLFVMTKASTLENKEMSTKDERIKFLNEILNGMKVIKLYAWEKSFQKQVEKIRNVEVGYLAKVSYLFAVAIVLWFIAPAFVMLASFVTFIYSAPNHILTAAKAFVSLSLLNILRFPITVLPWMITESVNAMVSIKRIQKFLNEDDVDEHSVLRLPKDSKTNFAIEIVNGSFAWLKSANQPVVNEEASEEETHSKILLKDVNLNVASGRLVAIVGNVGCGKSTLLSSLLGETVKLSGDVTIRGSIGYVPQEAWIQNLSIRDNILFGSEMQTDRYQKVVSSCQLESDLERFAAGDRTEIGERGINLSGGQRQRVALARAVYQRADIFLLDDPLAAVDAHVGKALFHKVIGNEGLLAGTTRLLVTHGIHWLPYVDEVLVISDGGISERGTYDSLLQKDGAFAAFLKDYYLNENEKHNLQVSSPKDIAVNEDYDEEIEATKAAIFQRLASVTSVSVSPPAFSPLTSPTSQSPSNAASVLRQRSTISQTSSDVIDIDNVHSATNQKSNHSTSQSPDKKPDLDLGKLIEDETAESGNVSMTSYNAYIQARGYFLFGMAVVIYFVYSGVNIFTNIWLSWWTSDSVFSNQTIIDDNSTTQFLRERTDYYMMIYGSLSLVELVIVFVFILLETVSALRASKFIHSKLLTRILRAPMSFFETTPTGRIVNRFSKDLEVVDRELPMVLTDFIECALATISSIIVISYTTPWFLLAVVPIGIIYFFVQRFYLPVSRQSRRFDSVTRSPILTNFSETITGAAVIRAYKQQNRFIDISDSRIDSNSRFYFLKLASNRWLGIRLEFLGVVAVLMAALFAVLKRDSLSGGAVGLSITYALEISDTLNWMVRQITELETDAVAIERLNEYSQVVQEADWETSVLPPSDWPASGRVMLVNYATRYRDDLDLALKGLSFTVDPGERIGVVGRTGAGKSSLALSLFRLVEAAYGHIEIDGVRLDRLGLHTLRQRLTILPQEPIIFSGPLRFNLDPFDEHEDSVVWKALESAYLAEWLRSQPEGLEFRCGEAGSNLSVGQRQLLCLARAVLRRSRLLVLDEATASVDLETDSKVMTTVRKEFASSTVFIIAHRLATVMDCDRVLVLDAGKVCEFASPKELLLNTNSYFYKLAKDAKLVNETETDNQVVNESQLPSTSTGRPVSSSDIQPADVSHTHVLTEVDVDVQQPNNDIIDNCSTAGETETQQD